MEVLERYFPEINNHLLNDRLATVATSLADFKILIEANERSVSLYGPVYDGLALGALAQPGWTTNLGEELENLGGAALSFGYFRSQGFPCSEEEWRRAFVEEPRPDSRRDEVQRSWPSSACPRQGFSSKQKRWIMLNLRASGLALLEVLQRAMGRYSRDRHVDFLGHEVRKTLLSVYPYDPVRCLTWREMLGLEKEPKVQAEKNDPREELRDRKKRSSERRRDDAVMATHRDQVKAWLDFSRERRGKTGKTTRVALLEAPAAVGYDPDAPPLDIRQRLGPPPVKSPESRSKILSTTDTFLIVEGSDTGSELERKDSLPDGKAPPRHGKVVRQQLREQGRGDEKEGVAAETLRRRNRRTLKRFFTAITTDRTALYPRTFLGPMICHQCGKKTHGPEICWITLWKQGGALPRNRTMPCLYCKSRQHVVDACCYLHHRCAGCGLLGHVQAECRDRTSEVWKQLFLECAEYGVLTGRNPFGPIRGRFGLGRPPREPEGIELAESLRLKLEQRASGEKWLMDSAEGFKEAVEAKRRENDPFDLWWRGIMTDEDVQAMKARLDGQGGKESEVGEKRRVYKRKLHPKDRVKGQEKTSKKR